MNKIRNANIAGTVTYVLSWMLFATYAYCARHEKFFSDHSSLLWIIGSKAIDVAIIFAVLGAVITTVSFFLFNRNKHTTINLILAYLLPAFFLSIFLLGLVAGGA